FVAVEDDPWGLVSSLMDALPSGSYLALSHLTRDNMDPVRVEGVEQVYEAASERIFFRTRAEIERFFDGLELVSPYSDAEPRVEFWGLWGAEDVELADSDGSRWGLGGVARKP